MSKIRTGVCGVGVNDANYPICNCVFYTVWSRMLGRCYGNAKTRNNPTYRHATVCKEWLLFSNFRKWMSTQDYSGKHLDKDCVRPFNTVYSPATCCFIDNRINCSLKVHSTGSKARLYYPNSTNTSFGAAIMRNDKLKHLGMFSSPEEAVRVYARAKYEALIELARTQQNPRVVAGLCTHADLLKRGVL